MLLTEEEKEREKLERTKRTKTTTEYETKYDYNTYKNLGGILEKEEYEEVLKIKPREMSKNLAEIVTAAFIDLLKRTKIEEPKLFTEYEIYETIIAKYIEYFEKVKKDRKKIRIKEENARRLDFLLLYNEAYRIIGEDKRKLFSKINYYIIKNKK